MIVRNRLRHALIFGLLLLSVAGALLHDAVHPPEKVAYGYVPMITLIVSVALTPWLFYFKRTLHLAYLLNGFAVIVGTVTMGHYSLVNRALWLDIVILWSKFAIGYALFHLLTFPTTADYKPKGFKALRYPHFGYWVSHLLAVSTVYAVGRAIWG